MDYFVVIDMSDLTEWSTVVHDESWRCFPLTAERHNPHIKDGKYQHVDKNVWFKADVVVTSVSCVLSEFVCPISIFVFLTSRFLFNFKISPRTHMMS